MSEALYDVLCFGAHPDDCEMGMAGTLALLTRAGRRVLCVTLTHGDKGTFGDPQSRLREFERAAAILGCDMRILDLLDTRVANTDENRKKVVDLVRRHRPEIVFAPYHTNEAGHHDGRANIDHMETGRIVRDGLKLARLRAVEPETPAHDVRRVFYYMVPADRRPDLIIDVTSVEGPLLESIQAYDSQMAIRRGDVRVEEVLVLSRRYYGLQIGVRLGEAFLADQVLDLRVEDLFRS